MFFKTGLHTCETAWRHGPAVTVSCRHNDCSASRGAHGNHHPLVFNAVAAVNCCVCIPGVWIVPLVGCVCIPGVWIVPLVCCFFCFYTNCYSHTHLCCVCYRDVQSDTRDSCDRHRVTWVLQLLLCFPVDCDGDWRFVSCWLSKAWRFWKLVVFCTYRNSSRLTVRLAEQLLASQRRPWSVELITLAYREYLKLSRYKVDNLVLRLRIRGTLTPLTPYVFTAWWLIKHM